MRHIRDVISSLSTSSPQPQDQKIFHFFHPVFFSGLSGYCDGGNACIINTPWSAVHFLRAVFCILQGKSLQKMQKWEFFVLAKKAEKGCTISLFGAPSFFSPPPFLTASCLEAGSVIRAYFEEALCHVIQNPISFFVKDGLFNSCSLSIPTFGFAKTSALIIDQGLLHQKGIWFVQQEHDFIVRLHNYAHTIHRVQFLGGDPVPYFSYLAFLSRDIIFPGYPYGLLVADRFARVSNEERNYILCLFETVAGKEWQRIRAGIHLLNAHDILDSVS